MFSFFSMPNREKGQGLIIYVLFLLFIVMVAIAVMRIIQPVSGIDVASFDADSRYWNDPANGCNANYIYGNDPDCDRIMDRVQSCLNGSTGPYCDEYFARFP